MFRREIKNTNRGRRSQSGQIMAEYIVAMSMAITGIYFSLVAGIEIDLDPDPNVDQMFTIPSVSEIIAAREKRYRNAMYLPLMADVQAPAGP